VKNDLYELSRKRRSVRRYGEKHIDDEIINENNDDDELLPDSLDPSYACASAACGALNWVEVERTDVPARKAFWTWYLDEAIPQALAS